MHNNVTKQSTPSNWKKEQTNRATDYPLGDIKRRNCFSPRASIVRETRRCAC